MILLGDRLTWFSLFLFLACFYGVMFHPQFQNGAKTHIYMTEYRLTLFFEVVTQLRQVRNLQCYSSQLVNIVFKNLLTINWAKRMYMLNYK